MKIKNPLTPAEIVRHGPDGAVAKQHGLHTADAALVLHPEGGRGSAAAANGSGRSARRIIAEVFVGLVHGDHNSYLWRKGKNWKPTLPSETPGEFTMADLLRFVGDINPIDHITT